jgi:molybdate transport system substrate-binding protein
MNATTDDIRVMTSGAFTAAYLELVPRLERLTKKKLVTAATSIGTGETSIPNRLRRSEPVDVVIVADGVLVGFIKEGLIIAESYTPLARSAIGMAVRAGAPKPDISTVDALRRTLLRAKSIAYSASVSGEYVSGELYQRLGIADQVVSKSRRIEGGERVCAVIARGEAEIGFQQMSELLPVPGIDHVTPLPPEVQKVSVFSAGVSVTTRDSGAAHAVIRFLASPEARDAITRSGLEPIGAR